MWQESAAGGAIAGHKGNELKGQTGEAENVPGHNIDAAVAPIAIVPSCRHANLQRHIDTAQDEAIGLSHASTARLAHPRGHDGSPGPRGLMMLEGRRQALLKDSRMWKAAWPQPAWRV